MRALGTQLAHAARPPGRWSPPGCAGRRPGPRGRSPSRWPAHQVVAVLADVGPDSWRPRGGVSMTEMSRMPVRDICSVRGMGVAERLTTSTCSLSWRSSSFWRTPKRCSSSTMTRPRSSRHDVATEQPVGADQHVHLAVGELLEDAALLGGAAKARDHLHAHRQLREALAEGPVVLLGEDRGGHQHQRLLAALGRLEGGPQGHLGLAVADVAADQAVHG